MMAMAAALVYAALAGVTVIFHLCLILGAPWGHLTMGGRWPGRLPGAGRLASALSVVLLALTAHVVLARAGLVRPLLPLWSIWPVTLWMALGIGLHIVTPSRAERRLWLPVVTLMTLSALILALGAG